MASRRSGDSRPGDWRVTLGRVALRLAERLLGGSMEPAIQRRRHDESRSEDLAAEPERLQSTAEAARALERALTHFESVLGQLEERAEQPISEEEEGDMEPQELSGLRRT